MSWSKLNQRMLCLGLLLAGAAAVWAEDSPWASKADMPTPRDSFAAAVVNGWIYTFGGRVQPDDGLQTVEAYHPATDQWVRKADMPTARRGASAVVVDGKIYVMGGIFGNPGLKALAAVEVYDPATDTWTRRADMLRPRGFTAAEVVDGKIYVIAGYSSGGTTSTVQEYDPATDQWTEKSRMPVANSHLASGLVGERIYVVGGLDFPSAFLVYDPAADTWERQEDLPIGRILPGVAVVGGMLYVMGGVPSSSSGTPTATVGQYDPSTGIWSERAAMPTARAGLSAIAVEGKVYALGGATGNAPWQTPKQVLGTVEEYTPAMDQTPAPVRPTEIPPSEVLPGRGLFTEVAQEAVSAPLLYGRSTAFGDYDNDGRPDIFIVEGFGPRIALWHNEGNGRFADQTTAIQDPVTPQWKGGGSIFGDFDNDGDLDLYVPVGMFYSDRREQNVLLRNDRGVFRDVSLKAGLTDSLSTDNALWLDYDRDGFLDIYTGNQGCAPAVPGMRNKLYRNQGDRTFAEVTRQAGLDIEMVEHGPCGGGSNGGMAAGDFNDDGWPDLYVGNHDGPNYLFLNDGKGGFQDATTKEVGDPGAASCVAVGDIDNDGDLEIFQAAGVGTAVLERSLMLLNLGQGQFLDVTEGVGLTGLYGQSVAGVGLADIDNDGDLDLLVAQPHLLYLNQGDGTFVDQTSHSGIHAVSWALSFGDYDLDGFLDVLWGGDGVFGGLFRNQGNANHSLQVELVGIKSNRSGIGARLFATSGELRQVREILGGLGLYQDELVAHFGLGQWTKVDRLEVRWPSGQVDVLTDIPADQKIRVFEGRGTYYPVTLPQWVTVPDILTANSVANVALAVQPALFEPGAEVTSVVADLSELGGPEAVPLQANSDGIYRLEPLSLALEGPNDFRTLSVMIDQQTSLGPYWTRLSRQVTVVPGGDLVVFDEALAQGWQVKGNTRIKRLDLSEVGVVHQGRLAGAFEGEAAFSPWNVTFKPSAPISPVGYTALRFAFHPGDVVPPSTARFTVTLLPSKVVNLLDSARVNLNRQEWQVVEIPVEAFEREGSIESITFTGNFAGTFFLDDLRLVAATPPPVTVVEEDRTTALPQAFSLAQNFPNPFNSDTLIRFALPDKGEVELAVYNLAGQQVVKLAEGAREAGSYTVRWDGRDSGGRELASGIYLYRLRAGAQVEIRKLALVR